MMSIFFYIRNAHSPSYIVFLNLMFIHMPCNLQESYLCTSILQFKLAISEAKSAVSSSTNEITEEDTSSSILIPGTTPTWTIAEASEHTDVRHRTHFQFTCTHKAKVQAYLSTKIKQHKQNHKPIPYNCIYSFCYLSNFFSFICLLIQTPYSCRSNQATS